MSTQNKTAAFHLFHSWVGWRIPEYSTLTAYATQEYGLFLPEDKQKARAILLNKKFVMYRPFEIAQYLATGGALDINDPQDGIKVYGWIMEHLANWIKHIETPQLLPKPIPIVGLREFNVLANKLFPVANRYGYFKKPEATMADAVASLFGEVKLTQQQHRFNDTLIKRIEAGYRKRGGKR